MTDAGADPGAADHRGPGRYLWWLVVRQRRRVAAGASLGSLWMVGLMLPPYVLSRAIDEGLAPGHTAALVGWAGVLLAVGALNAVLAVMRHRTMTRIRMDATFRTVRVLVAHTMRLGAALPRQVTAGEVVTIGIGDVAVISQTLTVTGPGVGAVLAYATVAALLLAVSPLLAAVVLVGVPLLAVLVGPLLGRLEGAETRYRERQSGLAARLADLVGGLRVLNGLGGKGVFADRYHREARALRSEGYRVGAVTSWIQALGVGLPALFLAAVTWLAARMAAQGTITVGELVAVYGYAAALVVPVSFLIEGGYDLTRGLVAARRVVRFLDLAPAPSDGTSRGPGTASALRDPASGVEVAPGQLTALACARPEQSASVIDRLGRFADSAATWGAVRLDALDPEALREADPGRRQRGRPVRRDAARGGLRAAGPRHGGDRPRRPHRHGTGHRPGSAGRARRGGRGAGPQPLRRAASARTAGAGVAGRSRGAARGRADLGGRRPHRGRTRDPAARRAGGPYHRRHQHLPAGPRPGRHRVLPGRRPGRGRRQPPCAPRSPPRLPPSGLPRRGRRRTRQRRQDAGVPRRTGRTRRHRRRARGRRPVSPEGAR